MSFFNVILKSNTKIARLFLICNWTLLWVGALSLLSSQRISWSLPFELLFNFHDYSWYGTLLGLIVTGLMSAHSLLMAIFFGFWIRGTYNNMRVFPHLERLYFTRSKPWCTIFPVINLYLPFFILHEIYEETLYAFTEKNIQPEKKLNTAFIKILWFVTVFQALDSIALSPFLRFFFLNGSEYGILILNTCTFLFSILGVYAAHRIVNDYNEIEHLVVHYSANENEPEEDIY